jgi:hypothetical protein
METYVGPLKILKKSSEEHLMSPSKFFDPVPTAFVQDSEK